MTVASPRRESELVAAVREDITEIKRDVKEIVTKLNSHVESAGHPIMQQQLDTLRQDVDTLKNRPLKTWQVVAGIVGLIVSLIFVFLSCSGFILSLLTFFRVHP